MKDDTKALLKGSYKTAIAAVLTLYIANTVDTTYSFYTWDWFRHFLFQCVVVIMGMEARYWLKWTQNGKVENETKIP